MGNYCCIQKQYPASRPFGPSNRSNEAGSGFGGWKTSATCHSWLLPRPLSRLKRAGSIERLSKGLYYRSRQTAFGQSRPNPAEIQRLASRRTTMFPSGTAAANLLGFTTQNAKRSEVATSALSLPRKLVGMETLNHNAATRGLDESFRNRRPRCSTFYVDTANQVSCRPTTQSKEPCVLSRRKDDSSDCLQSRNPNHHECAQCSAPSESKSGKDRRHFNHFETSLNPLSRFDFGMLTGLRYAAIGKRRSDPEVRLFEHPDFDQAVLRAAEHFRGQGLRPAIIEKDYYVTETLRIIAATAGDKVIFKGGTSLSKGWNLIQRFSEDIDLFLDPRAFQPALGRNAVIENSKLYATQSKLIRLSRSFRKKAEHLVASAARTISPIHNYSEASAKS